MPGKTKARCAALAAAWAGWCTFALADTWDNSSGDAMWSTASNWADNGEPTSGDTAIVRMRGF